jgi:hypothetical protein
MGKRAGELRRIGFSAADGIEFAEGADRRQGSYGWPPRSGHPSVRDGRPVDDDALPDVLLFLSRRRRRWWRRSL